MCTFLFQVIDLKGGNGDDSKAYLPIMAHVSLSVLFFSNATSAFPPSLLLLLTSGHLLDMK